MALSQDRKKALKAIGHNLNPIVIVAGNGLTENVMMEINRALEDHELIKVKFAVGDRDLKKELIEQMLKAARATLVHSIGHVVLILRESRQPDHKKSNLKR